MQLQFQKQEVPCLHNLLTRVHTLEQTQEVTVPEGRDGEEILGVWGQVLLRSKERQGDALRITGGILAWVLLSGGEGESPLSMDAWIPFRLDWDLPDGGAAGTDRILLVISGVDARWTGAGKLLLRAGLSVLADCWQPEAVPVPVPTEVPEDVALRRQRWPVCLPREAGEKTFSLEEALTLPSTAAGVARILYCRMEPEITDRKVLGNKLVFRGNAGLHMAYLCPEGLVHSWDFQLPFSQYDELSGSYSSDARADVLMALTRLELERSEDGSLRLQAGLTGQYLVEDRQMLETVTDAYSPRREVTLERQSLTLPVVLDTFRETVSGGQRLPDETSAAADTVVLTDMPRFTRQGDKTVLELPQRAQMLYYDGEGKLRSTSHRWTQSMELRAGEGTALTAQPGPARTRLVPEAEGMMLEAETPVSVTVTDGSGIPAVTLLELGELREPDPDRPSLILRRSGTDSLWDLARCSGSTVEAIRQANGLEGEPEPGRMLLIPVV